MTDERWQRVKALFLAAVERPVEERDAFLAETGDDDALCREVRSLLTSDAAGASIFDRLPVAGEPLLGDLLSPDRRRWVGHRAQVLVPGRRIGPYEMVAPLGAGGMGEVYKARDTRLDRTVAIKVLPARRRARSSSARTLRTRSARRRRPEPSAHLHAARHRASGGIDFLVMEFLEGETLAARLAKGPLPFDAGARARDPDCVGARQSPPRRDRASRSEARQHLPRPQRQGCSAADREAARLRVGQGHDARGAAIAAAVTAAPRISRGPA